MVQAVITGLVAIGIRPGALIRSLGIDIRGLIPAWKRYVALPDDANAQAVIDLLPMYDVGVSAREQRLAEHVDRNLGVLETRVLEGHRLSALLAVRLKTISDGSVSSCLNMIIGPYVHVDPQHFLVLMNEHSHLGGFRKMYCNLGMDLVDDTPGQAREARRRIRAVAHVDSPELRKVRDRVIQDLARSRP